LLGNFAATLFTTTLIAHLRVTTNLAQSRALTQASILDNARGDLGVLVVYNQGLASSPRIGKRQKLGTLTETASHLSLGERDV